MARPNVLLTRRWPDAVEQRLGQSYEVTLNERDLPMDRGALVEALRTQDAVCPTVTDGLGHTRSAVVGGGTPYARDDRDCAASPRRFEELTESIGGCFPRIPSRGRKERQAAGRGELDHRGPPGFDHAVLRRDRIAERSFHARGQVLTMAR